MPGHTQRQTALPAYYLTCVVSRLHPPVLGMWLSSLLCVYFPVCRIYSRLTFPTLLTTLLSMSIMSALILLPTTGLLLRSVYGAMMFLRRERVWPRSRPRTPPLHTPHTTTWSRTEDFGRCCLGSASCSTDIASHINCCHNQRIPAPCRFSGLCRGTFRSDCLCWRLHLAPCYKNHKVLLPSPGCRDHRLCSSRRPAQMRTHVAACPRSFPVVRRGRLVLTTLSTLDPFTCHAWLEPRPSFSQWSWRGTSSASMLARYAPPNSGFVVALDGAAAGDYPALRDGCVVTLCRNLHECRSAPLALLTPLTALKTQENFSGMQHIASSPRPLTMWLRADATYPMLCFFQCRPGLKMEFLPRGSMFMFSAMPVLGVYMATDLPLESDSEETIFDSPSEVIEGPPVSITATDPPASAAVEVNTSLPYDQRPPLDAVHSSTDTDIEWARGTGCYQPTPACQPRIPCWLQKFPHMRGPLSPLEPSRSPITMHVWQLELSKFSLSQVKQHALISTKCCTPGFSIWPPPGTCCQCILHAWMSSTVSTKETLISRSPACSLSLGPLPYSEDYFV